MIPNGVKTGAKAFSHRVRSILHPDGARAGSCHGGASGLVSPGTRKLGIVGNPNVGKSLVFNRLTGGHAVVSNYPGTTVDVTRGRMKTDAGEIEVVDTPGMYSLLPITEEERVARSVLLSERPDVILQVADARNLERMLSFTLQLVEAGLPVILALNMMDEAASAGVSIDAPKLERELGIPVVATVATLGKGIAELRGRIAGYAPAGHSPLHRRPYDAELESALDTIESRLNGEYGISKMAVALLLVQGDREMETSVAAREVDYGAVERVLAEVRGRYNQPLSYVVSMARQGEIRRILGAVMADGGKAGNGFADKLSRAMMRPLTGVPILLAFLYFGLYQFVGVLGASTLVGWLENTVFGNWVNPGVARLVTALVPWEAVRALFVGQYGIFTLGLTYAFALILPIVGTFFVVFSIIEDSGYLPRLAMLVDRVFKTIGLSGRAVIPMVLGFGCDTMATIVTRTQETKRERVLATLLLALAIPCSAQLGVIFAILSGSPAALFIWGLAVTVVFLLVGFLAARVIPGDRPSFYMEIPPLRLPRLANVVSKTLTRLQWYLFEVFPVFVAASVILWAGDLTGLLDRAGRALGPVVAFIGLPPEAGPVFLYGFFRRDFGAAGLYQLQTDGVLTGVSLVVAAVTLTLFVPCVAQFSVMLKERGWKTAVAIAGFIFPFAFVAGFGLDRLLKAMGVTL
jgi:ferrous iron transport protein B